MVGREDALSFFVSRLGLVSRARGGGGGGDAASLMMLRAFDGGVSTVDIFSRRLDGRRGAVQRGSGRQT